MPESNVIAYYAIDLPGFDEDDMYIAWLWCQQHENDYALDLMSREQTDDGWRFVFITEPGSELIDVLQKDMRKQLEDKKITVRFAKEVRL